MAQINVKLSQEKLDKWDSHKEELGFNSRSEFVRFVVNNEVEDESNNESSNTADIDSESLNQITDSIETLTTQVQTLNDRIGTLENAVQKDPQTEELADNIFTLLPEEEPRTPVWEKEDENLYEEYQHTDSEEAKKRHLAHKGTPEKLAEALEEPLRKVHVALDSLIAETHLIERKETEEATYYYKEV